MSLVDQHYRRGIAKWSGARRVERSEALLSEMREILARKVEASDPHLTSAQVVRRVAECLYRSDRETQRLLSSLDR